MPGAPFGARRPSTRPRAWSPACTPFVCHRHARMRSECRSRCQSSLCPEGRLLFRRPGESAYPGGPADFRQASHWFSQSGRVFLSADLRKAEREFPCSRRQPLHHSPPQNSRLPAPDSLPRNNLRASEEGRPTTRRLRSPYYETTSSALTSAAHYRII